MSRAVDGRYLDATVLARRGAFTLDVSVAAERGEVIAVVGPNGAGKSTLLAVLAGLLVPDGGTVRLRGRTLTGPGVQVPPERRRVGIMGQDPLLFPHLTAAENIAFGPRAQGVPRRRAIARARDWLGRLGLAEFAGRRPDALSGGQRQRVALARALAADPELLLLDEPLGALDAQTAPEIRQVLRTHLRAGETTTILVTHDAVDAATLADRALVLVDGSVTDAGPTASVLAAPRSEFSAALAGLNLLTGMTMSPADAGAPVTVTLGGATISGLAAERIDAGVWAAAVFPPAAVAVYLRPPATGSPRNFWPATLTGIEPGRSAIRVQARIDGPADMPVIAADVTAAAVAELGLHPGSEVSLAVKATEVRVHRR